MRHQGGINWTQVSLSWLLDSFCASLELALSGRGNCPSGKRGAQLTWLRHRLQVGGSQQTLGKQRELSSKSTSQYPHHSAKVMGPSRAPKVWISTGPLRKEARIRMQKPWGGGGRERESTAGNEDQLSTPAQKAAEGRRAQPVSNSWRITPEVWVTPQAIHYTHHTHVV